MSSTPSYPSPSFQPKRNSAQNVQLPLPSTLRAQSPTRPQFNTSAPTGTTSRPNSTHSVTSATPQTPQRPRGMSVLANRALGANFSPTTPNVTSSPHNRSTHAGGIQPSVSFFRPSRPDYQETYSRPSSIASSDEVTEHIPETDGFALSRLSPVGSPTRPHVASETEEVDLDVMGEAHMGGVQVDDQEGTLHEEDAQGGREYNRSIGRAKQSKEPLLPISGRPGGLGARRNTSGRQCPTVGLGLTVPKAQNVEKRMSGGSLMKTSIDRVFSLGRGLSIDSIRRPTLEAEEGRLTPIVNNHRHSAHFRRSSASPSTPRFKRTSGYYQGHVKQHSHSLSVSRHTPISPSPDPSFISQLPEVSIPLSQVPIKDPKTGRVVRRYEQHPSRNRFFFRGHLLTGGDSPWAFIICLIIVFGLSGVWFATTCVWWWHHKSPAVAAVGAYMALLAISSMLATVIEHMVTLRLTNFLTGIHRSGDLAS